jgi:soluble lytic murein transglycosylase
MKRISILGGLILAAFFIVQTGLPYMQRSFYPLYHYEYIAQSAARYKVDPFLVSAVIRVESKFQENAVSNRGARGLMQIMPATGQWAAQQMGLEGFKEDMLFDPRVNIQIGTWYLSSLSREFDGQLPVMIAAYNGGRGNVSSWLKAGVWDGTYESRRDIPYSETRAFLERVMDSYEQYRRLYSR